MKDSDGIPARQLRRPLFFIFFIVPFLSGCALFRSGTPGTDYGGRELTADSLAAIVNRQALTLGAVRGSGSLLVRTAAFPKGRKLDVSLVARRPDQVRVRGRVGILASIFDFVATADSLWLYLPREDALVAQAGDRGETQSIVASRELVQALLPPPIDRATLADPAGILRSADGWTVTRTDVDSLGNRLIRQGLYEPERLRLVSMLVRRISATATTTARVAYSAHRWTGHAWFPGRIVLELPDLEQGLELTFATFDPNPPLDTDIFTLKVPPRTRRIDPEELSDDFLLQAPPGE